MSIRVTCEHCGQQSTAAEKLRGKTLACPKCGTTMAVPAFSPEDEIISEEPILAAVPAEHDSGNSSHSSGNGSHGSGNGSHGSGHDAHADLFAPRAKPKDGSAGIDMTAMVDIVFFLLIYFLVTSFVQLVAAIHAPSTSARVGRKSSGEESTSLTVKIDSDNVVWIEQDPVYGNPEIYSRLKVVKEEVGAEKLRIAASSEATHGKLVLVLDAGISAGFKSAQLSLEESQ